MAMLRILMSLAAIAMLLGSTMATNYTVGGPDGGWDQISDLFGWAASKTFYVGDNLIFSYALSHSVLEVTKASFDSCEITSPIAIYTGGTTVITLASVGKRYFICGTGGHCTVGRMKLEINTLSKAFPPPPPAKPATPPTATPKAPPPSTPKIPPPSSPTTPPASAPYTTPVASPPTSSPSPKSSSVPSPKNGHKISPAMSPSKSHAHSPAMPPAGVPTSPTVEAVGLPPSDAPAPTPSAPSSADKISVIAGSTVGFGFVVMLMFLL
ncbi:hypothetical protein K7X08_028040 [Anisodus acutangulus]|uniref:Phytocyanin domain-containing protein n=1 Tax=Anisodus acutangulus TaxID=402998 RepID=A0A9Q1MU34_9SOLA|nr:hypothetical protein K7X08_028040 [Anisodus acutangulus]